MERLTERIDTVPIIKDCHIRWRHIDGNSINLSDAIDKLAAYEDTGLTPEEIKDFKVWLNEDREDLNDITIFNDLSELMKYRKTGVRSEEIFKLKQELENWKRESKSDKAKLGEIRIWLKPIGVTIEEILVEAKK